jgi:hypothetical protein
MTESTPPTRRRRFQFGIGTLFVVLTAFGAILAYHVNWIRQRAALRGPEFGERYYFTLPVQGPYLLQLFGEPGYIEVLVNLTQDVPGLAWDGTRMNGVRRLTPQEREEVKRIRRLYPEAIRVVGGFKDAKVSTANRDVLWPFVEASED